MAEKSISMSDKRWLALAFQYDCCCDQGGGGAAAPVDYQRTVRRFPLKMYAISSYSEGKSWVNMKRWTSTKLRLSQTKTPSRFTYLPWAEVKRSSERGAAISLPLPFRARALESAAVASRSWTPTEMALFSHPVLLQQRQGNGRHSGSSRRKVIPWWYLIRRPTMSATAKPVSFGDGLLNAPHSAFVSRQQGELLPSYWYIFDSSAGVLHQKPN